MRAALLRALTRRADRDLLPTFLAAARDPEEQVALAALEALTRLRDEAAAPVFLELAQRGTEKTKVAAVRGYLQIAQARGDRDGAAALALYRQALQLAARDEERRLALAGLARLALPESLPLIRPFLERGKLRDAAAAAVVPIADKLVKAGKKDQAIELYRLAFERLKDRRLIRETGAKLRALGITPPDRAAAQGYLTHWWVLGPLPNRDLWRKQDALPTDQPVDLSREVGVGNRTYRWKYAPVDDPLGMLDLKRAVARMDNCGAYVYAEVTSDTAQDVVFHFGSDDDLFCWLNGRRIHAFRGSRGWGPDQDRVETRLEAGVNRILLKVLNGAGAWACSLRITDRRGNPLQLEQRRK